MCQQYGQVFCFFDGVVCAHSRAAFIDGAAAAVSAHPLAPKPDRRTALIRRPDTAAAQLLCVRTDPPLGSSNVFSARGINVWRIY